MTRKFLSTFTQACRVWKCSILSRFPTPRPPCSKVPVPCLRLWSTLSSALDTKRTIASVSYIIILRRVILTHSMNERFLVLTYGLNNDRSFSTDRPPSSPQPPETSPILFFLIGRMNNVRSKYSTKCTSIFYFLSYYWFFQIIVSYSLNISPVIYLNFKIVSLTFVPRKC